MKRPIIAIAVIVVSFPACTPQSSVANINSSQRKPESISAAQPESGKPCVNLNTASAKELAALPGIGEVIAERIVEYRESHGGFRRKEDVIIIEGFSEKRYLTIADSICVER